MGQLLRLGCLRRPAEGTPPAGTVSCCTWCRPVHAAGGAIWACSIGQCGHALLPGQLHDATCMCSKGLRSTAGPADSPCADQRLHMAERAPPGGVDLQCSSEDNRGSAEWNMHVHWEFRGTAGLADSPCDESGWQAAAGGTWPTRSLLGGVDMQCPTTRGLALQRCNIHVLQEISRGTPGLADSPCGDPARSPLWHPARPGCSHATKNCPQQTALATRCLWCRQVQQQMHGEWRSTAAAASISCCVNLMQAVQDGPGSRVHHYSHCKATRGCARQHKLAPTPGSRVYRCLAAKHRAAVHASTSWAPLEFQASVCHSHTYHYLQACQFATGRSPEPWLRLAVSQHCDLLP